MCEQCLEESDSDYEGESIAAKRRKAMRSIIDRHPELGLDAEEVTLRFGPKAEQTCVRVNAGAHPRYEIHCPSYAATAMSGSPPLREIALAAFFASENSVEEIADILGTGPGLEHGAVFVSENPPLNPARAEAEPDVYDYEQDIQAHLEESE